MSMRKPTAICSRLSGSIGGLIVGLMASTTPVQSVPKPIFGSGQPGTDNDLFSEPARQLSAGAATAHRCSGDSQGMGCQAE